MTISIKYYTGIHSDNDILQTLGIIESEGCKKPVVTNKKLLILEQ
jgi:hypothetical protein